MSPDPAPSVVLGVLPLGFLKACQFSLWRSPNTILSVTMLLLLSNSASAKMQNSDGTGFGNHAI